MFFECGKKCFDFRRYACLPGVLLLGVFCLPLAGAAAEPPEKKVAQSQPGDASINKQTDAGSEMSQSAVGPFSNGDFEQISAWIGRGDLLPARSRVENLLTRDPDNWRVALLAGRLYRRMGLSGLAIVQYEKVRAHDPGMVEALVALSQLHLENLSTEIAIVLARRAVELAPRSKDARLALVNALLAGQSLKQASEQADQLALIYPGDAEVAHARFAVQQSFGQLDDATSLLLSALAKRPQMIAWRLELADLYLSRNDFDACRQALEQVLAVEPHSLEALNALAHLYEFDLHEYMKALRAYRAIREIIPDSAAAQIGIDRCLSKQSDFALNVRNAIYRLLNIKVRDAKLEEGNDLPSSL
ncbi:MAG: tetratricopeptide repeat protein [Cyanobacteria bacterium REEB67]|nr:tetratricopeptide repeat protein [Cyanobacteria bacterium REEB67]